MPPFTAACFGVVAAIGLLIATRTLRKKYKLAQITISVGSFFFSLFVTSLFITEGYEQLSGKYLMWVWLLYLAYWLYANRAKSAGKE